MNMQINGKKITSESLQKTLDDLEEKLRQKQDITNKSGVTGKDALSVYEETEITPLREKIARIKKLINLVQEEEGK